MKEQPEGRESVERLQHSARFERLNVRELESIERLAAEHGGKDFEADAQRLAGLHVINPDEPVQSIKRQSDTSVIGMSDVPFMALQRVCEGLIEREPALLERTNYRQRDTSCTALPLTLWLALVRHAREQFDPAMLDAAFLVARMLEGLTSEQAFKALVAAKRGHP